MPIRIVTLDAFTDVPFAGNPAAVCVLPEGRPDEWLRHVAREMNLSDTVFLVRRDDEFELRWLTPTVEVGRPPACRRSDRARRPGGDRHAGDGSRLTLRRCRQPFE